MKKTLILISLLLLLGVTTVSAQPVKTINVLYNDKVLQPKPGQEARIINNRIYVPVYLLREADFSVQYKNMTLTIFDKKEKFIGNLNTLNRFNSTYLSNFLKLDQEAFDVLGKILLEENADYRSLTELLSDVKSDAKSFDYETYTIVSDTNYLFLDAPTSVEEYSKAIDALLKYKETSDKTDLKAFYTHRAQALQLFNNVKLEFDQLFKLSLLKSLSL